MRTLEPPNRRRIGLMGIIVVLLAVGVGQSLTTVPMLFARPSYYGAFANTGGLHEGDKVRVAGMDVGKVQDLSIDGDHVKVKFSVDNGTIGTESRLRIRTDTILGRKVLEIEPRGGQRLRAGATLPLAQSTTPYQIYDQFTDIVKDAGGWDVNTVKQSLNVLSETVNQTYPHLSAALDGVAKFSDTIGKRDDQIKHLLAQANQVASVLGDRSGQINALLVNAQTLLAAFNARGRAIDTLLSNVSAVATQVQNVINDSPNLNHVLEQLRTLSDMLVERKSDIAESFIRAAKFVGALNEAVASGPYFKVMIVNLLPYQILQPWVDAAFKKRGIDPEEFWRSAGLPEFRFPDPNGPRFPNGAPSAAPPVLEGTPEHPGPAVAPGSPCSYTPAPGALPSAAIPLPCAMTEQLPFGAPPSGGYGLPDVLSLPPGPDAAPGPGIDSSALPGEMAPSVPGVAVPIPADAPPGARTGPGPGNPAAAPPPPPLPPGPPAPAGPGPRVSGGDLCLNVLFCPGQGG